MTYCKTERQGTSLPFPPYLHAFADAGVSVAATVNHHDEPATGSSDAYIDDGVGNADGFFYKIGVFQIVSGLLDGQLLH